MIHSNYIVYPPEHTTIAYPNVRCVNLYWRHTFITIPMDNWAGWIRTNVCRSQRPVPYRLATTQYMKTSPVGLEPTHHEHDEWLSKPYQLWTYGDT